VHSHRVVRVAGLVAALLAGAVVPGAGPSAAAEPGPPLSVAPAKLAAALDCPQAFSHPAHEPVLLVHGTWADPDVNWGWNYLPWLRGHGFDTCTVRLPDKSLRDIQEQAEYVVYAVREMHARSGRKVDMLGHSQGSLQPRWAVAWWPDVRAAVDDIVTLAGPHHGTAIAQPAQQCFESCTQMRPGSNFLAALNRGDETPGDVDYTSLYSLTDELVQPALPEATAALEGARNVLVQELCPGRPVEHLQFAFDAAVHVMVMDALTEPGTFDPDRFDPVSACSGTWFDGAEPSGLLESGQGYEFPVDDTFVAAPEPELRCYATDPPTCPGDDGPDDDGPDEGDDDRATTAADDGGSRRNPGDGDASDSGVVAAASTDAGTRGTLPRTGGPGLPVAALALLGGAALAHAAGRRVHVAG